MHRNVYESGARQVICEVFQYQAQSCLFNDSRIEKITGTYVYV